MSDFKITGNPNPVIGKEEFYSIGNPVAKTFPYTAIPKSPFDTPVLWTLHILENGRWRKTKENDKKGDKVSYTFLQRSLGRKGIRIMATRGEQTARLDIDTHPADKPKIDSIDLLDKSGKKPSKPLSYGQTLKARVHCLHMEKRKVFVTLWEDDAKGAGHNKENEKNIIETRWGFVEDGIVDIDFLLRPSFAKIATRGGEEKDKIHEYYVTTNFDNEKLASNNVNVNELETPTPPFKGKVPVQQPVKNIPAQQPKAQAPATPTQAKPKGAISSVKITDADGNAIKGVYRDKQIKVWIYSTGLAGKEIRLKLYDEDYVSNDILVDQKFTITKDIFPIIVTLNKIPRSRGGDTGEGAEQEVFADVEVLESNKHTVSAVVDVDAKAFKPDPVEATNNVMKIGEADKKDEKKGDGKCVCKEYNLIWGNKVSCAFRKKVVEMAKRLGKDPNLLMAGMALETGKTFSPTAGKGTSYVGLIQFGDSAAESVGTTRVALLKMTEIEQLDYVEKYLEKKKDKINTLTDFYLSILMPVDVGKGNQPNAVVFDNEFPLVYKKDGVTLTDLSKSRHFGYRQNPFFFHEDGEKKRWTDGGGKKYDGPGKTYIWEIEKSISNVYEQGKKNTAAVFECQKGNPSVKPILESGTWNVTVTEKYTGSKCTHIEKTPVRDNCRRGKLEVFDHNKKLVLTFEDCLLEGIAGSNHKTTNADAPYGTYQINNENPFNKSNKSNEVSYGPNPRLVFEPIKDSGDEADLSGRSAIRVHGGRQEGYKVKTLKRTQGCVRVWDSDAKDLYDWWVRYKKENPSVKAGKLVIKK